MMEDSEDFVDVASIAAKIKERVQRRKASEQQFSSNVSSLAARLEFAISLRDRLASGVYAVGDIPPAPPTVRAKAGLMAVRAVQRALFWYTPPIRRFQEDSARAVADLAQVCLALMRESQNLAVAVRGVSAVANDPDNPRSELGTTQTPWDDEVQLTRWLAAARQEMTETSLLKEQVRASSARALELQAQLDALQASVMELQSQSQSHTEALRAEIAALGSQVQELVTLPAQVGELKARLQELTALPSHVAAQAAQTRALEAATAAIPATLTTQSQELAALRAQVETQTAQIRVLETATEITAVNGQLRELQAEMNRRAQHIQALDRLAHHTRAANVLQERRLSLVLAEARRQGLVSAAADLSAEVTPLALYSELTAMFRGAEEEIGGRQAAYLPYLDIMHTPHSRAVDLGCGRGEWLDVLRQQGISALGVETNPEFVTQCRERGLEIAQADVLSWLEQCPERTVNLVTAFHLVEHLTPNDLLRFLDGVLRVLRPGGVAIFETPNPANLQVAGRTFWLDPTHQRPLPSELLLFLVEARGFSQLEFVALHPYPESFRFGQEAGTVGEFLNNHFFGPQDYAVVARRP